MKNRSVMVLGVVLIVLGVLALAYQGITYTKREKILDVGPPAVGAFPCTGFVTFDELMTHLRPLGVWSVRGGRNGWESPA